ncbi:DNA-binding protein SMUBP-2, putative [Babesia ovata]|uniref:DNA-binding protein SMUBP-2, putative n=1 Tax=Babesia ovata TaxID=189622 RepID=A0A2H6K751_9APIC|nr:DNA-binding protein SMUBP-2, putative [Babesia ovata]GBE58815.1 DNA-binding protein SMUBP-2, putative [Babesia ovata]
MSQSASDSEEERLLQEQFNSIAFCNFKEPDGQSLCSEQVRVVGHDCKFCRKRFCIRHLLPEVHGCNPKPPKLNKHGRPKKRP